MDALLLNGEGGGVTDSSPCLSAFHLHVAQSRADNFGHVAAEEGGEPF